MNTRCARRHRLPPGSSLRHAAPLNDARALLFFAEGAGARVEVIDPDGARRVLLRREANQLSLWAWDTHSRRLVVSVDSEPFVFDLQTEEPLGRLAGVSPTLWELAQAGAGRMMGASSDGWRRLWDLSTLDLVTQQHLRWYKGWSAPVGLLPGDPMLTCLTSMRRGQWVSALVNAHTGSDVARHRWPASQPAHHSAIPRPGALEWVGVICEGSEDAWGVSRVLHFTADGARLIDEAPMFGSIPGVVRLLFLSADWLYTEGWRDPTLINLRTGERRACPREGEVSENGLMLCHAERAVYALDTGALAPLYPGDAPEEGRRVQSISPDGATALVSTPEALEWWHISR